MRQAGQASWLMSIDEPRNLAMGLFIRDVAGLTSTHTWLPPAAPTVPPAGGGSPAASRQWDEWWDQALAAGTSAAWPEAAAFWWGPPDFDSLDAAPELQVLVRRHFLVAVRWSEARKREHVALVMDSDGGMDYSTRLVANLERAAGRRARPFNLRVTEIPVAGSELWQLSPEHVVVTAGLLGEPEEYRRRITPVLQALL